MEQNHIATKQDIAQAKSEIIAFIKKALAEADLKPASPQPEKYLRSRDVKAMLGVSDNKLKNMRLSGELPFTKIGKTFFYPADKVHRTFGGGLNRSQP